MEDYGKLISKSLTPQSLMNFFVDAGKIRILKNFKILNVCLMKFQKEDITLSGPFT